MTYCKFATYFHESNRGFTKHIGFLRTTFKIQFQKTLNNMHKNSVKGATGIGGGWYERHRLTSQV